MLLLGAACSSIASGHLQYYFGLHLESALTRAEFEQDASYAQGSWSSLQDQVRSYSVDSISHNANILVSPPDIVISCDWLHYRLIFLRDERTDNLPTRLASLPCPLWMTVRRGHDMVDD